MSWEKVCDVSEDWILFRTGSGLGLGFLLWNKRRDEKIELPVVEMRKTLMDGFHFELLSKLEQIDGADIMAILISAFYRTELRIDDGRAKRKVPKPKITPC